MAKTKTTAEKIAETKEKIRQLENQHKQLLQKYKEQERKARTHRLIERGAMLESLIDGGERLNNEQIKSILEAALNTETAIEMLASMQSQHNLNSIETSETVQGAGR